MSSKKTDKLNSFFVKVNKKATCQIKVPAETGAICGKVLATPDGSTTSLRSHIKSFHTEAALEIIQFEAEFVRKREEDEKRLEKLYTQVEKRTPKKRDQPDHPDSPDSASASDNPDADTVGPSGKNIRNNSFLVYFSNVNKRIFEIIRF